MSLLSILVLLKGIFVIFDSKLQRKAMGYIPKLHECGRNFGQISQCDGRNAGKCTSAVCKASGKIIFFSFIVKCNAVMCQTKVILQRDQNLGNPNSGRSATF